MQEQVRAPVRWSHNLFAAKGVGEFLVAFLYSFLAAEDEIDYEPNEIHELNWQAYVVVRIYHKSHKWMKMLRFRRYHSTSCQIFLSVILDHDWLVPELYNLQYVYDAQEHHTDSGHARCPIDEYLVNQVEANKSEYEIVLFSQKHLNLEYFLLAVKPEEIVGEVAKDDDEG